MRDEKFVRKFVKEFNRTFGPPFLPERFAVARIINKNEFEIVIGRRDTTFDTTGRSIGGGTFLASPWQIRKSARKR